ncbi:DUF1768-domain-containing protein [Panus rudis PR-1116 ss-1]|nr:DUF1768-domain-containing protein [Panus rudis PR-1116 ss-1]
MSTPTTPQTAIPIITEVYDSPPVYTVERTDSQEGPIQYRVEERRRTIYVTTNAPPSSQTVDQLFKLAEIPEGDGAEFDHRRRTKSLEERDLHTADTMPGGSEDKAESPRRTRRLHRKSPSASVSRNSYARTTPPNSPSTYSPASYSNIRKSWTMVRPPPVLFYHRHEPHYGFTNFSAHPVTYEGKVYPTSEHLFQSFKFHGHRPGLAEHIRTCSDRPSVAFSEARRFQPEVRHDWMAVNIQMMDEALWHKFSQHADLREELLATGDAELIENSDKDAFWGCGADGKGRNELGKALERLRNTLRSQQHV